MAAATSSVRQSPIARRAWLGALGTGAALGTLVLLLNLAQLDATLYDKDFAQEYLLARAILEGVDPYVPIRDLGARYVGVAGYFGKDLPTPHPPTVGLLALPLGLISYPSALRIWFGFELACLVTAVALLLRGAGAPVRLRSAPLLALGLIAWPPMTLELGLGQLMLPLLLGLAGAQLALVSGRSALGGGLLGLTLLIKPIALPWLIVLAWRRHWRALVAAAVVVLAGGILSAVAIGVGPFANYLIHVLPNMSGFFLMESTNMSLWTVAPRLGSVWLSSVLPAVVLLAAAWWSSRRFPLGVSLSIATIAGLLASPILWYFYLVLALQPLTQVMAAVWRRGMRRLEVAAACAAFALMSVSQSLLQALGRGPLGAGILLEPALALVLLGILLAWLTYSAVPASPPQSTL